MKGNIKDFRKKVNNLRWDKDSNSTLKGTKGNFKDYATYRTTYFESSRKERMNKRKERCTDVIYNLLSLYKTIKLFKWREILWQTPQKRRMIHMWLYLYKFSWDPVIL